MAADPAPVPSKTAQAYSALEELIVTMELEPGTLLSETELHLLSEWLDIGAQYFNNPFDDRLVE